MKELKPYAENNKFILYNTKTVKQLFTNIKDKDEKMRKSNVVYKIKCNFCESVYVGQTKQYLQKRVGQHKYDCKMHNINKTEKTALASHRFKENHTFNFEETKIVDIEQNWYKRNISEMIHIELDNNNINYKTDTQNLNSFYKSILTKYKLINSNRLI